MSLDNDLVESLPTGYRINGVAHYCQNSKPTGSGIVAGDRWYKPADASDWFWNGSVWLSTQLFHVKSDYNQEEFTATKNVSGSVLQGRDISTGQAGIYFVSFTVDFYPYVATTASNYWSFTQDAFYLDGTVENIASLSGASKTGDGWHKLKTMINSPKSTLTKSLSLTYCAATEVGIATTMVCMTELEFRHIHP